MARRLYALLLVLFILIPTTSIVVKAAGTGYLAIKDYLGKVWTMDDVNKIINYEFTTPDGEKKSLADYFWVVVDNDKNQKYNLRDFTTSPLDGKTAVIPLSPGDHYVDIYWFGYHQRQLVHIVEGEHYILNLQTAPVVPLRTAGEPSPSYEWDFVYSPDGLMIQRRDGNAYVLFKYNTSYIVVAWKEENYVTYGGWNYRTLDIYIDGDYKWYFHIKNPAIEWYNKTYNQKIKLLWKTFNYPTTYVSEHLNWSRNGTILRVTYQLFISHYKLDKMIIDLNRDLFLAGWVALKELDPLAPYTGYITRINDYAQWLRGSMDKKVMVSSLGYTDSIIIVWDIIVSPTQIIVLAHAYDIDANGKVHPKPITSANAFTVDNRLMFEKQLQGGLQLSFDDILDYELTIYQVGATEPVKELTILPYKYIGKGDEPTIVYMPGYPYYKFHVDDIKKYSLLMMFTFNIRVWVEGDNATAYGKVLVYPALYIDFEDVEKADFFEQILRANNITYTRDNNVFIFKDTLQYAYNLTDFIKDVTIKVQYINDYKEILDLIPPNTRATIGMQIRGEVWGTASCGSTKHYRVYNVHVIYSVNPKIEVPHISLLTDGFQTVDGAFAVQVYTQLVREDTDLYMLGYYLLGNDPPPSFVIRDAHYDKSNDTLYYVWSIITADAYGQDIVDLSWDEKSNETNFYLRIKPTIRTYDNVTFALFNYNKMAFLHLSPELIETLLAVPPSYTGYGTPIIDLLSLKILTINTTRPYKLYYRANGTFIEVNTVFYNDTLIYDIVRENDSIVIEKLSPGDKSRYFYKLVYLDNNETHYGWLYNDNGTLKIITGVVIKWSLPEDIINRIIVLTVPDIYKQWLDYWNKIAEQFGLMYNRLNSIINWLNKNWIWILLGIAGLFLLMALVTRNESKVIITRRF